MLRKHAWILALVALVLLLPLGGCSGTSSAEGEQAEGEQVEGEQAEGEPVDDTASPDGEADKGEDEPEKKKKKKKKKERSTSITAAPVIRGQLVIPVVAEGSIRARSTTEIRFEAAGRLEKVWVREGQRVRRGQKLASLDDREIQLALEEAHSRYLQGLAQLAVEEEGYSSQAAERVLEQQRDALIAEQSKGKITRDEFLDRELALGMKAVRDGAYRRELLEVRSGLAAARADTARYKLDLERTQLLAPFDGVVTGLTLVSGEHVQVGETLARVVDDVNVEAEVGVLESDLGALGVGRPALVTIPALGHTVPVKVDVISPDISSDSRTCSVLLRLKSEGGKIKPGMFVRAAIAGEVFDDRLLVPREAILTRDGRPVVFKVEDGRASWVYVQLGERNDHVVEIVRIDQGGPLEPGTLVIVDNHLTLTHEAKIKVKKKVDVTDPWAVTAESS